MLLAPIHEALNNLIKKSVLLILFQYIAKYNINPRTIH